MKKTTITVSFAIAGIVASSIAMAAEKPHWGYSGNEGPEYWGELASEFSTCSNGKINRLSSKGSIKHMPSERNG